MNNIDELKQDMKENNINRLSEYDDVATLTTSNFGGLVIKVNSTGESVFISDEYGQENPEVVEKEIEYQLGEGGFFYKFGNFYKLNEFVRKGI